MKILIISQYFWPENFRVNDLSLELKKRGHSVSVLTGIPNYPQGKYYDKYKFYNKKIEFWNDIKIYRSFLFPRGKGGGIRLIRKKGKLGNNQVMRADYGLEYGEDSFEMAYLPEFDLGKVVIVDDVYATGGTMQAAQGLCEKLGYEVSDKLCLMDIGIVKDHDVKCLISYE